MAEEIKSKTEKLEKVEKSEKLEKIEKKEKKEKVKIVDRIKKFLKDYKSELKKIVWSTKAQLIQNTGVVLFAIIFMALIIGLLDLAFGFGINGLGLLRDFINR